MSMIENMFPWFGQMMDLGGYILLVIVLLAVFLWALILERCLFLGLTYPHLESQAKVLWQARRERQSWYADQYRKHILYSVGVHAQRHLNLIRTLIKLCPLLGLLGTVLGMLEIFDAVAITGGTSPRATAGGVSKAIVTTMAGMVVAISGLPIVGYLSKKSQSHQQKLSNTITLDG